MNTPDYRTLLSLLESAKSLLARNAGDLTPADLRIRCLVNITGSETQRALLETEARDELVALSANQNTTPGKGTRNRAQCVSGR